MDKKPGISWGFIAFAIFSIFGVTISVVNVENFNIFFNKNVRYIEEEKVEEPRKIEYIKDNFAKGELSEDIDSIEYYYKTDGAGTYTFITEDRAAGADICINILDVKGNSVGDDYGTNKLSQELLEKTTYKIVLSKTSGNTPYTLKVLTPKDVQDITGESEIAGTVENTAQPMSYLYTAPRAGNYRIDLIERTRRDDLYFTIMDEHQDIIANQYYNSGNVELKSEQSYLIRVESYEEEPIDYILKLGVPDAEKDISDYSQVEGELRYEGECKTYVYKAPRYGTYRFDVEDRTEDKDVDVTILDNNRAEVDYAETNGKTVKLNSGKNYYIQLESSYEEPPIKYIMKIGVPDEVKTIKGFSKTGSIRYIDQINSYYFTPQTSGDYKISLVDCTEDLSAYICVLKASTLGEVASGYGEVSAELKSHTKYLLNIEESDGIMDYKIVIERVLD